MVIVCSGLVSSTPAPHGSHVAAIQRLFFFICHQIVSSVPISDAGVMNFRYSNSRKPG